MRINLPRGRLGNWLFDQQFKPRVIIVLGVLAFTLLFAVGIAFSAAADNTLHLPALGQGLLDHYGFQACLISAPIVLLSAYYAWSYFFQILHGLDDLIRPEAEPALLQRVIEPHIRSLFLRSRWRNILWLLMFIGASASIVIMRQLDAPTRFWGNDVFNAASYKWGYITTNIFLFLLWTIIYPTAIFLALHITISAEIIVSRLLKNDMISLNFLHTDKCGGMSRFGVLNFMVMLIYLWFFGVAYALHVTHKENYLSLVLGGIGASAAFILQSTYGLYWVSRSIRGEREKLVTALNSQIAARLGRGRKNYSDVLATLQYRDKVLAVSALPYAGAVGSAVNVLRVAPAMLSLAHLLIKA